MLDPLGRERAYVRTDDGARAGSLWPLVRAGDALDREGVLAAWGLSPQTAHSPISRIHGLRRPPLPRSAEAPLPLHALADRLAAALERRVRASPSVALGLSGGLDSVLLLAVLRAYSIPFPRLVTFETGFPEYDETAAATEAARAFGAEVEILSFTEADYIDALPEAVHACEAPLFNLHPVSRWLLLRRLGTQGVRLLITGDGADQVFAGSAAHLYIPIVSALAAGSGVASDSPYWDDGVLAFAGRLPPDPAKTVLRHLASELGVSRAVVERPKRARYTPAMDLAPHWLPDRVEALSAQLGVPAVFQDDRDRVRWTTLVLFGQGMEAPR